MAARAALRSMAGLVACSSTKSRTRLNSPRSSFGPAWGRSFSVRNLGVSAAVSKIRVSSQETSHALTPGALDGLLDKLPKNPLSGWTTFLNGLTSIRGNLGPWTLESLTLGLVALGKLTDSMPPAAIGKPATGLMKDGDFLMEAQHWRTLAEAAYADSAVLWSLTSGLPESAIIAAKWTPDPVTFRPAYVVAEDDAYGALVVSIRGTKDFFDVLEDASARPVTLDDGMAHEGMLDAANQIIEEVKDKVQETLKLKPNLDLLVVGHSLGAGAAVISSIILRKMYPNLQCWAYAPPACVDARLAARCRKFTISIIGEYDVVPRLSVAAVELLRQQLAKFDWNKVLELAKTNPDFKLLADAIQLLKIIQNTLLEAQKILDAIEKFFHFPGTAPSLQKAAAATLVATSDSSTTGGGQPNSSPLLQSATKLMADILEPLQGGTDFMGGPSAIPSTFFTDGGEDKQDKSSAEMEYWQPALGSNLQGASGQATGNAGVAQQMRSLLSGLTVAGGLLAMAAVSAVSTLGKSNPSVFADAASLNKKDSPRIQAMTATVQAMSIDGGRLDSFPQEKAAQKQAAEKQLEEAKARDPKEAEAGVENAIVTLVAPGRLLVLNSEGVKWRAPVLRLLVPYSRSYGIPVTYDEAHAATWTLQEAEVSDLREILVSSRMISDHMLTTPEEGLTSLQQYVAPFRSDLRVPKGSGNTTSTTVEAN